VSVPTQSNNNNSEETESDSYSESSSQIDPPIEHLPIPSGSPNPETETNQPKNTVDSDDETLIMMEDSSPLAAVAAAPSNSTGPKVVTSTAVPVYNLVGWQQVIEDSTITDLNDIIEQLLLLNQKQPGNQRIQKALDEAKEYQLQHSMRERKQLMVKRDLNDSQFKRRVGVDYDRKIPDEQHKIVVHSRQHYEHASKQPKQIKPPAPKSWGNQKVAITMTTPATNNDNCSPMSWLLGMAS